MVTHLNLAFLRVNHYFYEFTAEMIPYREQWNKVTKVEARIMILPHGYTTGAIRYVLL